MSPLRSPGNTVVVEATASLVVAMAEDEVSHLRAQLEAIQEAMAELEREVAHAMASRAEAQVQLLGEFLVRFLCPSF